jgi:hypothetical protein
MPLLGFSKQGFVSEGLFNLFGSYAMSELNMKRVAFIPLKIVNAQGLLHKKSYIVLLCAVEMSILFKEFIQQM